MVEVTSRAPPATTLTRRLSPPPATGDSLEQTKGIAPPHEPIPRSSSFAVCRSVPPYLRSHRTDRPSGWLRSFQPGRGNPEGTRRQPRHRPGDPVRRRRDGCRQVGGPDRRTRGLCDEPRPRPLHRGRDQLGAHRPGKGCQYPRGHNDNAEFCVAGCAHGGCPAGFACRW